ncbi:nitrilase-related carbon-nitrogen hydrolase, partial [Frankia sp. AvcI1]
MLTITSIGVPGSPARVAPPTRAPLRIAAVQHRWHPDPAEHAAALRAGAVAAAELGARLVCFQELTLSRYFADVPPEGQPPTDRGPDVRVPDGRLPAVGARPAGGGTWPAALAESVDDGPTRTLAAGLAAELGVAVHMSLYERADGPDGLGFNTAIVVGPDGALLARTRKMHIPVTAGYHEDRYFRPGP